MAIKRNPSAGNSSGEVVLKGTSICPGMGRGIVRFVDGETQAPERSISPDEVQAEQDRYRRAVSEVRDRLREHVEEMHQQDPCMDCEVILRAHEVMLADEEFHEAVRRRIARDLRNAEWALEEEGKGLIARFQAMRNPFFAARIEDVRDLVDNVLTTLTEGQPRLTKPPVDSREPWVAVSAHLRPSMATQAQRNGAVGFATESKALAAHAAILLKGFGIPTVGELEGLIDAARDGDEIFVDAVNGRVALRPEPATADLFVELEQKLERPLAEAPEPTVTRDGVEIALFANIENPGQVRFALQNGLEGIGLFRTEFIVLTRPGAPDEDEQYRVYRDVVEAAEGRPVTIRTFDVGADKRGDAFADCFGDNPALGVRGIRRHLLLEQEELETQVRAILRAAVDRDVSLLFPMVTNIDDVRGAQHHVETAKKDLADAGTPYSEEVRVGAMIEVPAAAIAVGEILKEVDFISIGTNDLMQYFMAADRDNEQVLQYNSAENPTFLWLLRFIIGKARNQDRIRDVSICGELASEPDVVPSLVQLGYRVLSISPVMADRVRATIAETAARTVPFDNTVLASGK